MAPGCWSVWDQPEYMVRRSLPRTPYVNANAALKRRGVINMYGVYQTHYHSHQLKDHSEASIALIGSLQGGLLLLVCAFAGPVYDAGYCKSLIYVGSACILTGMMITSICSQYWQLLLAQGLAVGIGGGLLYLPGMGIIQQYFKKKSAFAFGVASLGSSIGRFTHLVFIMSRL